MIEPIFEVKSEKETADFGIFIIEPLQQGYGHTIGNALRRVLLSSLPGAAITQIKISGVKHQFSTISGLDKDVVELILKIKRIRIKYKGEKPVKLVLEKTGPGEIKAGDIEAPTGVEILNKDLVLGTLSDKSSKIKMEMMAEVGLGYSLSEERSVDEIGVIPIDALFSPVVRVNYLVSATRVGRVINWDKLTLEIWTDGIITPKEALMQSAKTLNEFFQQMVTPRKELKKEVVKEKEISKEILEMSVEELELPTRIANSLIKAELMTVGNLVESGRKKIVKVKNLGIKSMKIIEAVLKEKNIEIPE